MVFNVIEAATLASVQVGKSCSFQVPVVVEGGRGTLLVGEKNIFGYRMAPRLGSGAILLQPRATNARIEIGSGNSFSNNVMICANGSVHIGNRCQIGDLVAIYDCDFHELEPATRNRGHGKVLPVDIGNNVWLGSRVMVLKGVSIGDNTVVGAGSIVVNSLPANCVAVGTPAKVVRELHPK